MPHARAGGTPGPGEAATAFCRAARALVWRGGDRGAAGADLRVSFPMSAMARAVSAMPAFTL